MSTPATLSAALEEYRDLAYSALGNDPQVYKEQYQTGMIKIGEAFARYNAAVIDGNATVMASAESDIQSVLAAASIDIDVSISVGDVTVPTVAVTTVENSDLDGSYEYTYNHLKAQTNKPSVIIFDGSDVFRTEAIKGTIIDSNNFKIGFGAPITGTWTIILAWFATS